MIAATLYAGVVLQNDIRVPFVDLRAVNLPLRDELLDAIGDLLERGSFVAGRDIEEFEEAFAEFCGVAHCVGLSSGLDAVRIALLVSGIEPGDEVIVPANTFIASIEAVVQAGGVPVLVDASLDDYNIDPALVEAAVTPKTRFLLPVHLYGQLSDMQPLRRIAAEHGLRIVEDACQAHGAERDGIRASELSVASAYSFYPAKNLGAAGDAGALVTDSEDAASHARALRQHGEVEKYRSAYPGYTARLDAIQAIVLSHKLPHLRGWNAERAAVAAAYTDALAGIEGLGVPPVPAGSSPVWHLYVVRTAKREELAEFLAARGIATARHYPVPPHLSGAFPELGDGPGSFPVAEALADELLSLPIFPGISGEQIELVCDGIRAFFADA
jgi:dTDP-4-amino-4,6-dideoxygalactose transaminase